MDWAHRTQVREENAHVVLWRNLYKNRVEDLRIAGKITLEWILKKLNRSVWNEFIWLWKGTLVFLIIVHYR
jgi:hypothetical protein